MESTNEIKEVKVVKDDDGEVTFFIGFILNLLVVLPLVAIVIAILYIIGKIESDQSETERLIAGIFTIIIFAPMSYYALVFRGFYYDNS